MLISTQLYHVDLSDNSSKGWEKKGNMFIFSFFLHASGYFTKPSLLDGEGHEGKSFIFKVLFLSGSFIAVRGSSDMVAILIVLLEVVTLIPASCTTPLSHFFFPLPCFFVHVKTCVCASVSFNKASIFSAG